MSNTSITNLQTSDTFQVWVNKTNEVIDLLNENTVLAGPGPGFTVEGNSTLIGSFTANTLNANTSTIGSLSLLSLSRSVDTDQSILSNSPIRIESNNENILDLQTSASNRPILRMINGGNARWVISQSNASSSAAFIVSTEGAISPQLTLTQAGRLTANEFEGSLIGNASSTSSLQTARTINGTSFDGTANITTANWGTSRAITIGNTGKSVNGSANVAWSLSEIGVNNSTLTLATSGIATGSQSWTSNQGSNATFTVNVPATNLSVTAGTTSGPTINSSTGTNVVLPAASTSESGIVTTGNQTFAGTKTFNSAIVGSLSGNATTATTLATTRTIWGQNFNGGANVTGNLTSVGNITGTGAITISSGGTNQPVTITTSGTGAINLDTGTGAGTINLRPGADPVRIWDDTSTNYFNIVTGTLSANRNLTLPNASVTLVGGTMVPTTRRIDTGAGLSGGGNLGSDREISISPGGVGTTEIASNAVSIFSQASIQYDGTSDRNFVTNVTMSATGQIAIWVLVKTLGTYSSTSRITARAFIDGNNIGGETTENGAPLRPQTLIGVQGGLSGTIPIRVELRDLRGLDAVFIKVLIMRRYR
jgi:hypothetical protein